MVSIRGGSIDGVDHVSHAAEGGLNVLFALLVNGFFADQVTAIVRPLELARKEGLDFAVGSRDDRAVALQLAAHIAFRALRDFTRLEEKPLDLVSVPRLRSSGLRVTSHSSLFAPQVVAPTDCSNIAANFSSTLRRTSFPEGPKKLVSLNVRSLTTQGPIRSSTACFELNARTRDSR